MKKYSPNDIISVTITAIEPYGAFAIVDDDYTGLIHISEINGKFIKDINKFIKIDSNIKAKVLEVDEEKKQIKLTLKNVKEVRKKNILKEVGSGFEILQKNLPKWINNKKNEINQIKNEKK